jgi:hypothetical protein
MLVQEFTMYRTSTLWGGQFMQIDTARNLFSQWKTRMLEGEWHEAWRVSDRVLELRNAEYEHRLPPNLRSVWNGERLDGKRVLVRCYHGLGDTIQFVRYLPLLSEIASEIIFCPQPALVELLSNVPAIGRYIHSGSGELSYDADVEIMELAHVFRTTLDTIPAEIPYLTADKEWLSSNDRLSVGLVWKAGNWDDRRSIQFDELAPLAGVPDVNLFGVQMDPPAAGWRPGPIEALQSGTIMYTAGIIQSLDLLITVDTMTAHLAGALGKPVWTLLQKDADWRWMKDREDSPWYPTMRLFRQEQQGDWIPVIANVAAEVDRMVSLKDQEASVRDRLRVPQHQFPPSIAPSPPL